MPQLLEQESAGLVNRGYIDDKIEELRRQLETGEVRVPVVLPPTPNLAGGTNHCPNSDLSFSTLAATVPGTLPGDVSDLNYEAYRFYWAVRGADVVLDDAHALKSVDHSLYAAGEGVDLGKPIWDRENGWIVDGSTGTLYDLIVQLPNNIVSPGQRWYVRFRIGALDATAVPADMEVFAGFWHKTATDELYIEGSAFDLDYEVKGTPGATTLEYCVLAKTDSGVELLSNVLTVTTANAALSTSNYVKLLFNPGPGFIEFVIYKKVGASYYHIYTVRNSSDLEYNDVGIVAFASEVVTGWPSVTQVSPQALAQTRDILIGAFGSDWQGNGVRIDVPQTYNYSETEVQYFRFGLSIAAGVNRHIGIDRIWLSTTHNEWSPDTVLPFSDGTFPVPSISPTSGTQGSGGGVLDPPEGGSGGPTCVVVKTPILTRERGRRVFKQLQSVRRGAELQGEERLPYAVLGMKRGVVSEYYEIKTKNGITLCCSVDHPLALSVRPRKRIQARHVKVGTRLAGEVKGRKTTTVVTEITLIPKPAEVGTPVLRHTGGLHRDGHGMYLAGESKTKDRALFCFNAKPTGYLFD